MTSHKMRETPPVSMLLCFRLSYSHLFTEQSQTHTIAGRLRTNRGSRTVKPAAHSEIPLIEAGIRPTANPSPADLADGLADEPHEVSSDSEIFCCCGSLCAYLRKLVGF